MAAASAASAAAVAATSPRAPADEAYAEDFEAEDAEHKQAAPASPSAQPQQPASEATQQQAGTVSASAPPASPPAPATPRASMPSRAAATDLPPAVPASAAPAAAAAAAAHLHKFRVSVDVRSVRDLTRNYNVYVRYAHPLFGAHAPFRSRPPVGVAKNTECLLPHSFCAYEFEMEVAQLWAALKEDPLILEVMHRDRYSQDLEIGSHSRARQRVRALELLLTSLSLARAGIAKIDLSHLRSAPLHPESRNGAELRVVDQYYTVFALANSEGAAQRRGASAD